jgi:hypothetical protein
MSVEVEVHYYEVVEALALYLKENYNMDLDLDIYSENCVLSEGIVEVEYRELDPVYKKHKNGRVVKNQYGHPIIDRKKSKNVKKYIFFDEGASFTFNINNKSGY